MHRHITLDVRSIPQWERHARIFAAFESLASGQALLVLTDHEPRPLRAQFDERYGAGYTWTARQLGDGRWEAEIAKNHRRCAVFADLDDAALAELYSHARSISVKRHQTIAEQGVNWPYAGIVQSGIVQAVLALPSGREQAVYDVLPDELFGETAILDGGTMPVRHVALTPTTVLAVPREAVTAAMKCNDGVAGALAQLAAQRMRTVLERFAVHIGSPASARIAQVLLPFAPPVQGLCDALPPLPQMTQHEIATSAGTVKEVVSRALAELEAARALQREGGRITQLDRGKLTDIISAHLA